ncbi:MAG: hypothetical protein EWM72_02756 [Nitrospira sp.]|nr:MAG: hypothetical protein EWM72_02756 [Nitrospira sp.]
MERVQEEQQPVTGSSILTGQGAIGREQLSQQDAVGQPGMSTATRRPYAP